jgi:hypothetical protein
MDFCSGNQVLLHRALVPQVRRNSDEIARAGTGTRVGG